MANISHRKYTCRISLSSNAHKFIDNLLYETRQLYNAALQERRDAYNRSIELYGKKDILSLIHI